MGPVGAESTTEVQQQSPSQSVHVNSGGAQGIAALLPRLLPFATLLLPGLDLAQWQW